MSENPHLREEDVDWGVSKAYLAICKVDERLWTQEVLCVPPEPRPMRIDIPTRIDIDGRWVGDTSEAASRMDRYLRCVMTTTSGLGAFRKLKQLRRLFRVIGEVASLERAYRFALEELPCLTRGDFVGTCAHAHWGVPEFVQLSADIIALQICLSDVDAIWRASSTEVRGHELEWCVVDELVPQKLELRDDFDNLPDADPPANGIVRRP